MLTETVPPTEHLESSISLADSVPATSTDCTTATKLEQVKHLLAEQPCRRPRSYRISNGKGIDPDIDLSKLAREYPPPSEWWSEEADPFSPDR